jgi:hypothetical protein
MGAQCCHHQWEPQWAILAPLGVLLCAHFLDRALPGDDHLVGYSGLIRMLVHAGELSFLGALGGGLGVF